MPRIGFGVVLRGSPSADAFRDVVKRAEGIGCDVIAAPDHLGAPDPFATLAAAAQITTRVRLRTYVVNVSFWNPALLARAVATTDLLSEGRVELGLGAGHMRTEHEEAGLPWRRHPIRVEQLEGTLIEVRRRVTDPDHEPQPAQDQIPLVVGAMTSPGLGVAARHADIVAFSGLLQVPGAAAATFTLASAGETERRVLEVPQQAAGRAYRSDALLQVIVLGEDPAAAAARLAAERTRSAPTEQAAGFTQIQRTSRRLCARDDTAAPGAEGQRAQPRNAHPCRAPAGYPFRDKGSRVNGVGGDARANMKAGLGIVDDVRLAIRQNRSRLAVGSG